MKNLKVLALCLCCSSFALAAGKAKVKEVPAASDKDSKEAKREAKEEAASHFSKGIDFYKEGNYAAALAEFRAAYKALPSYEVLFNIGLSERRLFKYGDSV